jgi:1-acyl-sn-glycerol-3-phosphate acyltransferase
MQLLRSLIFTAYMMSSALLFGGFMALCFWLPHHAQFSIARTWARLCFWMLDKVCGLGVSIEGRENIPAGNHIVMSNHTSAWETIAQFMIFPPQVWVLKRELLWIPLIGWGLKLLRPISINREAGHRAVNQVIDQGKQRLADGLWIIIFPEGTRVVAGATRKFGVGGALLATETGKYLVPFSHNAGDFWARRGILKRRGTVRVVIGAPISAAGKNPRHVNDEVKHAIDAGLAHIAATNSIQTPRPADG